MKNADDPVKHRLLAFTATEEIDGHRWGWFEQSNLFGGKNWQICFNCGMIRRYDKQHKPCKGPARVKARDGKEP